MSGTEGPGRRRPVALLLLAAVLAVEAAGTAVIALLALGASPLGDGGVTSGLAVAVFVLILAALLAVVAVGTVRARPWTRSATLVWQLIQALVGAYSLQGAGAAVGFGVPAIVLALVALVLLFSRPVRTALDRA